MSLGPSDIVQILPTRGEISKELQIVFWTYAVGNSNGNLKELKRKNSCKRLMFLRVFLVTVGNADIGNFTCNSVESVYATS